MSGMLMEAHICVDCKCRSCAYAIVNNQGANPVGGLQVPPKWGSGGCTASIHGLWGLASNDLIPVSVLLALCIIIGQSLLHEQLRL